MEPAETVIIRCQQYFHLLDQLNPTEIKIDDDQVINVLQNMKVLPTPTGLFFPSSVENDISQIF